MHTFPRFPGGTPALKCASCGANQRSARPGGAIWVALARVQAEYGLVKPEQVVELEKAAEKIDIPRALEIEAEIHHDLMAEVRTFAEQCPGAGGIIHLGATSMDIEDNADALRMKQALAILIDKLSNLLDALIQPDPRTRPYADHGIHPSSTCGTVHAGVSL